MCQVKVSFLTQRYSSKLLAVKRETRHGGRLAHRGTYGGGHTIHHPRQCQFVQSIIKVFVFLTMSYCIN